MPYLRLFLLLLMLSGCQLLPKNLLALQSGDNCPSQPTSALTKENVKTLTLNAQPHKEQSNVSSGRAVGYQFQAQAGYSLKYSLPDDICIIFYTPDNKPLRSQDFAKLPTTGTYTAHLFIPNGSATFDLELSLLNPSQAAAATPASPTAIANTPTPNPTINPTTNPTTSTELTQGQALQLLQSWLDAKKTVFASPYDRQVAAQLTTGKRYQDVMGAIDWLQQKNAYWRYLSPGKVEAAGKFVASANEATADVHITEDTEYYQGSRLMEATGRQTKTYTVQFKLDGGTWKIATMTEK